MGKRLFLFIIAGLIGVVGNPGFLTATDSFTLAGLDNTGVVETIPLPEPEVEEIASYPVATKSNVTNAQTTGVNAPVAGVAYTAPSNNIQYSGRTIQIVDVGDTSVNAGNHVNKYGAKFLYGHNSAGVFGGLIGLGIGSSFSVTYAGATTNYQVANIVIFEKNAENGLLQIDGFGDYMYAVASAVYDGVHYDMVLMTCYGTSYGNGDASHRWVVFANAI